MATCIFLGLVFHATGASSCVCKRSKRVDTELSSTASPIFTTRPPNLDKMLAKCLPKCSRNLGKVVYEIKLKVYKKKWLWCFFPSISDHLLQLSLEAWKQPFTWQRKELLMAFNPRSTVKLEAQLPTKPGWCYIPWSAGNLTDHESWWIIVDVYSDWKTMSFQDVSINFFLPKMWRMEHMKLNNNPFFKNVQYLYCQLLLTSPWMHTPWALFCMAAFTCHYCHLSPTRWRLDGRCFFRVWGVLQWKHAWFHRFSFKNVDGDRYVHIIQAIHNMMKLYL